jgi:hypothetical protein
MIEILVNDGSTTLEEFKVERVYEWDPNLKEKILVHKTYLSVSNITKEGSDMLKKQIQGDRPSKGFGRFDFEGSVSFNINDFYVTLYNVTLTNWTYEKRFNKLILKINFAPLDGFGYLSGMGLNVLRDQKLSQILNF